MEAQVLLGRDTRQQGRTGALNWEGPWPAPSVGSLEPMGFLGSDAQLLAPNSNSALLDTFGKRETGLNEHSFLHPGVSAQSTLLSFRGSKGGVVGVAQGITGWPPTQPALPQLTVVITAQGGDSVLHSRTGTVSGLSNSEGEQLSWADSQGSQSWSEGFFLDPGVCNSVNF